MIMLCETYRVAYHPANVARAKHHAARTMDVEEITDGEMEPDRVPARLSQHPFRRTRFQVVPRVRPPL